MSHKSTFHAVGFFYVRSALSSNIKQDAKGETSPPRPNQPHMQNNGMWKERLVGLRSEVAVGVLL